MAVGIVVNGVLGRMGKEIAQTVFTDSEVVLRGCIEREGHPSLGADIGGFLGIEKTGVTIRSSLKEIAGNVDVIIDFTTPASTRSLLQEIQGTTTAIVIGTTGLSDSDMALIKKASGANAILFSPNMSLGVNFLFYLTQIAAERLGGDFDIEIIEAHHRFKKDSPSGTAKMLGEIAAAARGSSYKEAASHGREGVVSERPTEQIGMHAVRGGDIVGDHTVLFAGIGERLEIRHCAHSRTTFARGAVKAAKWLHDQKPGLYSMRNVLGF